MKPTVAFVNFFREARGRRVVSVSDIVVNDADWPRHHSDFVPSRTYSVKWPHLPIEGSFSTDGEYEAKILCMGVSMEDLVHEAGLLGLRIPKTDIDKYTEKEKSPEKKVSSKGRTIKAVQPTVAPALSINAKKKKPSDSKVVKSTDNETGPSSHSKRKKKVTEEDSVRRKRNFDFIQNLVLPFPDEADEVADARASSPSPKIGKPGSIPSRSLSTSCVGDRSSSRPSSTISKRVADAGAALSSKVPKPGGSSPSLSRSLAKETAKGDSPLARSGSSLNKRVADARASSPSPKIGKPGSIPSRSLSTSCVGDRSSSRPSSTISKRVADAGAASSSKVPKPGRSSPSLSRSLAKEAAKGDLPSAHSGSTLKRQQKRTRKRSSSSSSSNSDVSSYASSNAVTNLYISKIQKLEQELKKLKHDKVSQDLGDVQNAKRTLSFGGSSHDSHHADNTTISQMIVDAYLNKAPLRSDGTGKVHLGNGVYVTTKLFEEKLMSTKVTPSIATRDLMSTLYSTKEMAERSLEGGTPVKGGPDRRALKKAQLTPAKRECLFGLFRAKTQIQTGSSDKNFLDLSVSKSAKSTVRDKLKESAKKIRDEAAAVLAAAAAADTADTADTDSPPDDYTVDDAAHSDGTPAAAAGDDAGCDSPASTAADDYADVDDAGSDSPPPADDAGSDSPPPADDAGSDGVHPGGSDGVHSSEEDDGSDGPLANLLSDADDAASGDADAGSDHLAPASA